MIERVVSVTAKCDRCGETITLSDIKFSKNRMIRWLRKTGWVVGKNEILCRRCKYGLPQSQTDLHKYKMLSTPIEKEKNERRWGND